MIGYPEVRILFLHVEIFTDIVFCAFRLEFLKPWHLTTKQLSPSQLFLPNERVCSFVFTLFASVLEIAESGRCHLPFSNEIEKLRRELTDVWFGFPNTGATRGLDGRGHQRK